MEKLILEILSQAESHGREKLELFQRRCARIFHVFLSSYLDSSLQIAASAQSTYTAVRVQCTRTRTYTIHIQYVPIGVVLRKHRLHRRYSYLRSRYRIRFFRMVCERRLPTVSRSCATSVRQVSIWNQSRLPACSTH